MELAFDDGLLRVAHTTDPPGLRVAGEIDQLNTLAFGEILQTAAGNGGDVHVDLAGLEFINVDGLRRLVDTANRLERGRLLVLGAVPGHLLRVMQLVGWDQTPGLEFEGVRT